MPPRVMEMAGLKRCLIFELVIVKSPCWDLFNLFWSSRHLYWVSVRWIALLSAWACSVDLLIKTLSCWYLMIWNAVKVILIFEELKSSSRLFAVLVFWDRSYFLLIHCWSLIDLNLVSSIFCDEQANNQNNQLAGKHTASFFTSC